MRFLGILLSCLLISCHGANKKPKKEATEYEKYVVQAKVDSMVDAVMRKAAFDTAGLSTSPVKVTSARLFREEYSNYKSIRLTFKNVSGKRIEAIRFKWYGEDAFGDPADMGTGAMVRGFGGGYDDDPLSPGKARTSEWSIYSSTGKKVVLAWAYEVAFSDGSKWEIE